MHDIFRLPPDGYPEELLPIRREIVSRTLAGHIDSAYEMYQFELSRLRELEIPVFELPREHFALEHRLEQLVNEQDADEIERLIARLNQLKLAAGFPRERLDDPMGAGKPEDLKQLEARMQAAAQPLDMSAHLTLTKQWLELMRFYGYPQPDDELAIEQYDAALAHEAELNRQIPPAYLSNLRALAMALYRGDLDEVMQLHETQLAMAEEHGYPVQRMSREHFELQHRISQAARRNDQDELAELQQELALTQEDAPDGLEMYEDPAGVMGLPPAYQDLSEACASAFERGDTAEAVRLSREMQEMLESSGNIYNIMNIIGNDGPEQA